MTKNIVENANIAESVFRAVNMAGTVFDDVNLADATFSNINMAGAKLHNINLSNVSISAANLRGAHFKHLGPPDEDGQRQKGVFFEEATLCDSLFDRTDLSNVKITDCEMEGMTIDGLPVARLISNYKKQFPDTNEAEKKELKRDDFRFYLRPCSPEDAEEVYEAVMESKVNVSRWMEWMHDAYTLQNSKSWAEEVQRVWAKASYEFVIVDSTDGQIAGCCGLNRINWMEKVCNLGYWVRDSETNLGAATEVATLLRDFGLDSRGFQRIEIVVAVGNVASQRVAEKVGALNEGIQRNRLRAQSQPRDARMNALIG